MSLLGNGECIDLQNYYMNLSRREFLRMAGGITVAGIGLDTLVERAYGADPEGRILVHTRDRSGRPAIVESVSPERYHRIKLLEEFDPSRIRHRNVQGASLRQRSDDRSDIVLQIGVPVSRIDGGTGRSPDDLPRPEDIPDVADVPRDPANLPGIERALSAAQNGRAASPADIPMEYMAVPENPTPQTLEGGSSLDNNDGGSAYNGTAGLVAYDSDSGDSVLYTAHHFTRSGESVYYDSTEINTVLNLDPANDYGQDAITYDLSQENVSTDSLGTKEIPDIEGYWTFSGLSNETTGWNDPNVPANFYGATSGEIQDPIDDTHRQTASGLDYLAHTGSGQTEDGDSGGPWVGDDGYLFGHHYGRNCGWFTCWSIVSVAGPSFDAVNVTLDPDGSDSMK